MNYVISVWDQTDAQHSSVIVTQVMDTQRECFIQTGQIIQYMISPRCDEKGFAPMHSNDWDLDNFN